MNNGFTVITPTGDRPIAFALSRKWMACQTVKPKRWVIIDDGKIPMDLGELRSYEYYVRREPQPNDPKHTLVVNVKESLPFIEGDKVLFWEDDEYYAPAYLEKMIKKLTSFSVVGIGCAKYYHLITGGYIEHQNMEHASLAQTGFDISVLPMIKSCVDKGMEKDWLDCNIWREVQRSKRSDDPISSMIFRDTDNPLFVGMKGLPGRFGIGIGHKTDSYKNHDDADRSKLKEWMPHDYPAYLDLLKEIAK